VNQFMTTKMLRNVLITGLVVSLAGCATATVQNSARQMSGEPPLAVPVSDAVMQRNPQVFRRWDYVGGLMLLGIHEVYRRTGDERYFAYVKENMDRWVQPDGSIQGYRMEEFNIDHVNQGKLLFPLYRRTGDERYRQAAELLREQMRRHPRTSEGGFWHKQIYPQQLWLDGLYMAAPFLAQYAVEFNEPELLDDVAHQILLMTRHTRDPQTGLLYHTWDETRSMHWADPQTGLSPNFWGRAMGWYMMALVDILDFLPENHPDRPEIIRIFRDASQALTRVQDPVTGMWYQVLDIPNREPNYLETSASSMFAYAFAKGARLGYLPAEYRDIAQRAYDGIVQQYVRTDEDGMLSVHGIVEVAGLGGPRMRDGSFEYYMSEPVVANDFKGVGPFVLASLELSR
jgi:unsaturated rhamnogalacturonyl hydrolase